MEKDKPSSAVTKSEKEMEYVPFASKDTIKLTASIVRRLIAVPTKSGKVPSDDDCFRFMMLCKAKALNPFEQDAYLIGYDGQDGPKFSLITAHQAFLKRAEVNDEYDGMKSGVMVMRDEKLVELEGDFHFDNDVLVGGWACVYFKNREHPMLKRIKLSRFNTGRSQWAKDPAGMIVKCAEADALRSSFPTMLGGMYIREESDQEVPPAAKVPIFTPPAAIDVASEARKSDDSPETPIATLRKLCESGGVSEALVVTMMKDIGMAEEESTTLDEQEEVNIKTVIAGWDEFLPRIKAQ